MALEFSPNLTVLTVKQLHYIVLSILGHNNFQPKLNFLKNTSIGHRKLMQWNFIYFWYYFWCKEIILFYARCWLEIFMKNKGNTQGFGPMVIPPWLEISVVHTNDLYANFPLTLNRPFSVPVVKGSSCLNLIEAYNRPIVWGQHLQNLFTSQIMDSDILPYTDSHFSPSCILINLQDSVSGETKLLQLIISIQRNVSIANYHIYLWWIESSTYPNFKPRDGNSNKYLQGACPRSSHRHKLCTHNHTYNLDYVSNNLQHSTIEEG